MQSNLPLQQPADALAKQVDPEWLVKIPLPVTLVYLPQGLFFWGDYGVIFVLLRHYFGVFGFHAFHGTVTFVRVIFEHPSYREMSLLRHRDAEVKCICLAAWSLVVLVVCRGGGG